MTPTRNLRPSGSRTVVTVAIVMAIAVSLGVSFWRSGPRRGSASLERALARQGKVLLPIAAAVPEGRAGQTIAVGLADLRRHELYLRDPGNDGNWLYLNDQGQILSRGGVLATVQRSVELLLVPSGVALFADAVPWGADTSTWQAFWVSAPDTGAVPEAKVIPRLEVRDDFARMELEVHPYSRITAGSVRLAQRGGGMPTTEAEVADFNFQRAVNPFAIQASDGGRLTYRVHAPERWGDAHVEARFYFGVPKTGNVVDRGTVPLSTDMLVTMGPEDGLQAAFGWSGAEGCFVLQTRSGDGLWTVLSRWRERRPPLTNWVKIGLQCRQGHRLEGVLDDAPVLAADLHVRLRGPFHIQGGNGLIEFDDVRAWSLPTPPPDPVPVLVRSRHFAGKHRKETADPEEFEEWASSSQAFGKVTWRDAATGAECAALVTGAGILGDVVCDSPALADPADDLGVGYRIALYPSGPEGTVDIRTAAPAATVRAERRAAGWAIWPVEGSAATPADPVTEPTLSVGRRADQGNRFCVRLAGRWLPVSGPVSGPVHLAVIRTHDPKAGTRLLLAPSVLNHTVTCSNLVNELFEEAPTAWGWVDGAFRMDCRWACQDQWNFMACGSTGLPCLTSKRVFTGDQTHEAFMSLRATFPWDAGDSTFTYDAASDRANKFPILVASGGWYNRHDLNVSFCSDGRNPLSGYTVVFGSDDNSATRLLRRGVSVAESRDLRHLFSRDPSFLAVHWTWWHFVVHKTGARLRVTLNGEPLFDYTDPEPIAGGHLSFWSVRNGFDISRVSSMAEGIAWASHASYVSGTADSTEQGWEPLVRDTVRLTAGPGPGLTTVTNAFGGGFFAVRHVPEHPIDLRQTPRLTLPLRLGPGTRVNLHLEIGGKPYVVRLGDTPLAGIKAFLVPGSEKGECFRLDAIPEAEVRARCCLAEVPAGEESLQLDLLKALRTLTGNSVEPILTCMTVGNSSNAGYLMAGGGGNEAGRSYSIGPPTFRGVGP
jgi:hypothetical protein